MKTPPWSIPLGVMTLASLCLMPLHPASGQEPGPTAACAPLVLEAWQAVSDRYLDPTFHGVDWAALRPDRPDARCVRGTPHAQVRALLSRLGDPSVRLVPADDAAAFLAEVGGEERVGVGLRELLSVDVDRDTGLLTVVTPVPGSPAARAGIRTGDVLESVDGVRTDTMDMALAVARLRGREGTSVRVEVRRGAEIRMSALRRKPIGPSPGAVLELRPEGDRGRFAYIRVPDFSAGTSDSLASALTRVGDADGLVLDLRDNPGGLVQELTGAADLFLDAGIPIARLRARPGADTLLVTEEAAHTRLPMAILVNRGTASAAEALTGALQAAGRATVLGERTFGKGLAHFATPLSDGSLLMAPSGRLQTPHGRDILEEGIAPDLIVDAPPLSVLVPATQADEPYREAVRLLATSRPQSASTPADSAAITSRALDYIEGWFDGDAGRVGRAVHPDLAKRIYQRTAGKRGTLVTTDGRELVRGAAEGYGRSAPRERIRTDVRILDVFRNSASVRIDAGLWVDYLHMARTELGWRIVNVLWELR